MVAGTIQVGIISSDQPVEEGDSISGRATTISRTLIDMVTRVRHLTTIPEAEEAGSLLTLARLVLGEEFHRRRPRTRAVGHHAATREDTTIIRLQTTPLEITSTTMVAGMGAVN